LEREETAHPERVVYASETFPRDVWDYQALAERAPWFLGEFVWTAMDYIGEAGIGATAQIKANVPYYMPSWPWVNAWCGDIDLVGQQKAPSLARDVAWGLSPLEMCVARPVPEGMHEFVANWGWPDELPCWSWPGEEGKVLHVRLYSKAERVELYLNGKPVGEHAMQPADKGKAEFIIAYAPGRLEARAYSNGRMIGRRLLETVGPAVRLRLESEIIPAHAAGGGLAYIGVKVVDAQGRVLPQDRRKIGLTVEGPARLLAFGSANPMAVGSLQAPSAETWRGRALAILRPTGAGAVRITARAEDLPEGRASISAPYK
jgi:beta-galactosidase